MHKNNNGQKKNKKEALCKIKIYENKYFIDQNEMEIKYSMQQNSTTKQNTGNICNDKYKSKS